MQARESLTAAAKTPLFRACILLLAGGAAFLYWDRLVSHSPDLGPILRVPHYHHQNASMLTPPATTALPQNAVASRPAVFRVSVTDRTQFDEDHLAAEGRQREQQARDQAALAERMRIEAEERQRAARKAAGRNVIVPFVWINGQRLRNVVKENVVTHSGTDETLIYRNGVASLYYVWEISGQLDSCLLRLREN